MASAAAMKIAEMKNAKSGENAAKAQEHMAAGKKYASTGFLGLSKPDWERAARSYQEAAKLYGLAGPASSKAYIDACVQCAQAYEKQDQYHPAAQHYEKAAIETAKSSSELKTAAQLFRTGARMFRLAEAPDKAAAIFMKAANTVGDVDVTLATELCSDACAVFEDEQRAMFANDTFKAAINYLLKKNKLKEAVSMLQRQNKVYLMVLKTFEHELYKNLLSILVLRFHLGEYEQAEKEYKEFQSMAEFASSSEGVAADALIDAWNNASAQDLEKALKLQTFTLLPNAMAVLSRKLVFDEAKLKAAVASRAAADASATAAATAVETAHLPKTATGELDLQ